MQTDVAEHPVLDFLWLELTNRCNLQCSHCYAQSGPHAGAGDVLGPADYERLLTESRSLGCRQVQFIGGEPTLNKALPGLLQTAARLEFDAIEVFTNLISLSEELLQSLIRCRVLVATSFYSANAGTHDRITRSIGSFGRTVRNIERVIGAGIPLRVGVIEMELNGGEFNATRTFLESLGATDIGFDQVRGFGRAQTTSACEMGDLCGQCATNILAIGPDGVVAPCIMSKAWTVGSVLKQSLGDIAASPQLAATRQRIAEATGVKSEADCWPACGPNRQQCMPECGPSRQCAPCGPNGGNKCYPNNNCGPAR